MARPLLLLPILAALLLQVSACSLLDPTHGMTVEQKAAYEAEQAAKKELQRAAQAEFDSKNVKDLNFAGEGHEEARNSELAGRYECKLAFPVGKHDFVLVKRDATYRKHKRLQLFDNGSFVEQTLYDVFESTDGGTSMGETEESWKRGMWKTSGEELWTRTLTVNGLSAWQLLGNYKFQSKDSQKLLVVGKQPQNALEALMAPRNDEGEVQDYSKVDIWASN